MDFGPVPSSQGQHAPDAEALRFPAASRRVKIGLVFDRYYPELHAGVVRAAREFDWELGQPLFSLRGAEGGLGDCDGVLLVTASAPDVGWLATLPCPVVGILDEAVEAEASGMAQVTLDFAEAGRMAARHLLALELPHLGFISRNEGGAEGLLGKSFMAACRSEGLRGFSCQVAPARERLKRQIAALPLPCGVLTDDDALAVELIDCARDLGFCVPEDLAVLGVKDVALVHGRSQVPVSSVHMNLEAAGHAAAETMHGILCGDLPADHRCVIAPKGIAARESTAVPTRGAPRISKALQKVRQDFSQPLTISLLAKEAGTSVRTLQRLYPLATGLSVSDDIMARRLEAAAGLLRRSRHKLQTIAAETGFRNAKNLCRRFKEAYGMTPGEWRESGSASAA